MFVFSGSEMFVSIFKGWNSLKTKGSFVFSESEDTLELESLSRLDDDDKDGHLEFWEISSNTSCC